MKRAELVRQYLETLTDDAQRTVCFLLMKGLSPEEVCKRMRISAERFELIRRETEVEMTNFGLAPDAWREEDRDDA